MIFVGKVINNFDFHMNDLLLLLYVSLEFTLISTYVKVNVKFNSLY